jgi:hypothetical protein
MFASEQESAIENDQVRGNGSNGLPEATGASDQRIGENLVLSFRL